MTKKSRLIDLVREILQLAVLVFEFLNQLLELVSKVVNYASPLPEFRVFIHKKGQACLCPK
jgi:hypothetical protein